MDFLEVPFLTIQDLIIIRRHRRLHFMDAAQDLDQAVILVILVIREDHIKEVRIKKNNIKSIIEMDQSMLSGPLFFDKSFILILNLKIDELWKQADKIPKSVYLLQNSAHTQPKFHTVC